MRRNWPTRATDWPDLPHRQHHVAGEKAFVDYSGKRVGIVDPSTGKMREAEIFAVDFALNAHMRSRSPCPGFCQFIT